VSMNIRLKNRKAVEEQLKHFIENAVLSPDDADAINHHPINDKFLQAVLSLNDKLQFLTRTAIAMGGRDLGILPCETKAGKELIPEMMALKTKAILRVKEFFLANILEMKKGKTNISIIQQNSLAKYAKLFKFLLREAPDMGHEVRSAYVEIMQKLVTSLFKNYYVCLLKMDILVASKNDLLVVEDAGMKSIFSQKIDFNFNKDKSTVGGETFAINGRDVVLQEVEAPPILIHVATAEKARFHFEALFRSLCKHLVDAASNEFLFLLDFFQTEVHDTFYKIFNRSLSMLLENLENYMIGSYDVVALLLCIRLTHSMRLIMSRRRIPVLDTFFDRVSNMLWPRFESVVDMNLRSLRAANVKEMGPVDLSPQYISKRFAELLCVLSILYDRNDRRQAPARGTGMEKVHGSKTSLDGMVEGSSHSTAAGGGSGHSSVGDMVSDKSETPIEITVARLRSEMIELLSRLAHAHIVSSKDQRVFYINNYDTILTCLQQRKISTSEVREFEDLLAAQKEYFAEEEVSAAFPRLVSFVRQTEQMINSLAKQQSEGEATGELNLDEAIVESLVKEFSSKWRGGVKQINDGVLAYFSNFRNGTDILKQVLTQLLLYYTRFQDIIKRVWASKPPPFSREIVSTATIMMEIRKYNRTF